MSNQTEPPRLLWLANRMRCTSVPEVVYRIRQAILSPLVRRKVCAIPGRVLGQSFTAGVTAIERPEGIDAASYLREANAILEGNVVLFESYPVNVGRDPDWNRCPRAEEHSRCDSGAADPDRGRNAGEDIKYVWELNRHLQWVRLAQAHVLTGDRSYSDGLATQIDSWLDQCPPLSGPNWSSAMELGIRLVNWSLLWRMLGGCEGILFRNAAGEDLRKRWTASIFAHCRFVRENLSRYSSANNHLIGEAAGLYVAARTWHFDEYSSSWAADAKAELERESAVQFFADGVHREQAFAYQAYVCECLAVAAIYGHQTGDPFSGEFWNVLRRACRFLRSASDAGGHFPMVGDADDGALLRLEPRDGRVRAALVSSMVESILGLRTVSKAGDAVRWLSGSISGLPETDRGLDTDWKYPYSGYIFFGSKFGEPDEIKGMIDCGPLGYLGIAAHGHADALAIVLSIAGEECLVDPGTCEYGGEYRWRNYFRGTAAHNTVRVDGLDQSVSGGRFMWTDKANVAVIKAPTSPGDFDFAGTHDGYMRLKDPVRHVRKVTYDHSSMSLLVIDELTGNARHEFEQFWHFAPRVEVQSRGDAIVVCGRRFRLQMQFLTGGLDMAAIRGQENPPLGWISRGYGTKEPTTVVRVRMQSPTASIQVRFTIQFLRQPS